MDNTFSYLNFINFSNISRWDVKRFCIQTPEIGENFVFLKDILQEYKNILSKEEIKNREIHIIQKINFSGKLFLRPLEDIETFKGTLYEIPPDSIIYSKINVRHGCTYYNSTKNTIVGTSEYPVFTFNSQIINGEYLQMVLRTNIIKDCLGAKTTGFSKTRVQVSEFLNTKIPLPSLKIQNEKVKNYYDKNNKINHIEQKIKSLINQKDNYINKQLGIINELNSINAKGLNFINYRELKKWGVSLILKERASTVSYSKNYPVKKIKEICSIGSGGTPSREISEYYINGSIPWVKTTEVRNNIIYKTEEQITNEALLNSSAKIYPAGSLIIAMYGQGETRGRTAKLGVDAATNQACCVLSNINKELCTDYLWIYLMNEYTRLRDLASGNNQPNLNAQMIASYPVIIPPVNIQKEIVKMIHNINEQIVQLKEEVEKIKLIAKEEFEKELFE